MDGNSDKYDGQVSMPFLIKMCFTIKKPQFYVKRANILPDHHNFWVRIIPSGGGKLLI